MSTTHHYCHHHHHHPAPAASGMDLLEVFPGEERMADLVPEGE